MIRRKLFFILIVLLFFVFSLHAEVFRVALTHIAVFSDNTDTKKIDCGINDAIVVLLPEEKLFWQGVALEIKIPQIVASYYDSVAYSLYRHVRPVPEPSVVDYSGERLFIDTLPGRLSYNIQLPVKKNHKLKTGPYSMLVPLTPDESETQFFIRLQQVMKGVPESLMVSRFDITVMPVFIDEGLLNIVLSPVPQECFVYIDEILAPLWEKGLFLLPGEHHVSVVTDQFRNEVRTVNIAQAQKTLLEIELQDIKPKMLFSVPENTVIELDGVILEDVQQEFVVTEGPHTVKMTVGNYETVRNIDVQNGKNYKLNLSMDLKITED
jgi:hypothetical protein